MVKLSNISVKIQDTLHDNKFLKAKDCKVWLSTIANKESFVTIRLVSAEESQQLNKQYRKINKPTNVLSFLINEQPLIGDLVLCHPIITSEAIEQKKEIIANYAHLVIHGYLHLLGYDHENESQAEIMEKKEIKLLDKLGYPNPYTSNIIK